MEKTKGFLKRLFPKDLRKYIPGEKLVAAAVLYALAEVFGVKEQIVAIFGVEVNTQELAAFIGFYLWPPGKEKE